MNYKWMGKTRILSAIYSDFLFVERVLKQRLDASLSYLHVLNSRKYGYPSGDS